MLLSAVSVLVVAQSSSEIPEGLINNPVERNYKLCPFIQWFGKRIRQTHTSPTFPLQFIRKNMLLDPYIWEWMWEIAFFRR